MVFSSLTFLFIFLPLLLIMYFAVPQKLRMARNIILLLFSIVFYGWGEPTYVFLILLTIVVTYLVSGKIALGKKWALIAAIACNILPLAIYKYLDFLVLNINLIPGIELPTTNLPLPIGISFYTFQMLTYIIDLFRKKVRWQKNPLYVALYLFLFPQLIAGPIVRYETVENEIENRKENWKDFYEGFHRFVIGFAKKVLIANQAGFVVKTIMEQETSQVGAGLLWFAVFSYAIQIYFDFSGYSDMAIGLGRMFGFHFLENFNYPYISRSISEFWRRWHISLSTFFRDYIYIPLGGSRVSTPRWLVNIFIVWFLTGMWHGPFWNYILWGLYYCVLLMVERMWLKRWLDKIPSLCSWAYTFFFTLLGWALFMKETNHPGELVAFWGRMFSFTRVEAGFTLRSLQLQPYMPYVILGFVLSFPLTAKIKEMNLFKKKAGAIASDLGIAMIYVIGLIFIVAESFNPFIYFRF